MDKKTKKEKKELEKSLIFYLSYYKEVTSRSKSMMNEFDFQIERIIEKLKEIGH
jgi:hypothetical protein